MSSYEYTAIPIADVYAEALLSLTEKEGISDEVMDQLGELVGLMESDAAFAGFMTSPSVDEDRRRDQLEKLRGKLHDVLLNALQVVNEKGRLDILPLIAERFRVQLEEVRNEVEIQVRSAVPLEEAARTKLAETAERITGRKARLVEKVDENILGGLIVRIGDEQLDTSVRRQLEQLQSRFLVRAGAELHSDKDYFA